MKGTIAIDPEYTRGTRTVICVPLPVASADQAAALQRKLSGSETPEAPGLTLPPRLAWLLVDDSELVRTSHRRILSKGGNGWEFAEAPTGEAALAMVSAGRQFDVIVMDQYMGKAGGTLLGNEAVRQLLAQRRCRSLIFGCSGNHNEPRVQQGFLEAGAAACWPKPLPDIQAIRAQLRELLPGFPGQVRVLIVDDQHTLRRVLRRTLASIGTASWQIAVEASASQALASMGFQPPEIPAWDAESKEPQDAEWTVGGRPLDATAPHDCGYDLIVLDEHMPGSIDGTAAMAVLREAGCNAVIVGFSGDDMEEEHRAAGADLSWRKPLPPQPELAAGLMEAFRARGYMA